MSHSSSVDPYDSGSQSWSINHAEAVEPMRMASPAVAAVRSNEGYSGYAHSPPPSAMPSVTSPAGADGAAGNYRGYQADDPFPAAGDDDEEFTRRYMHVQVQARKPFIPEASDPMSQRMRYYSRLGGNTGMLSLPAHCIPPHVVPPEVVVRSLRDFSVLGGGGGGGGGGDEGGKSGAAAGDDKKIGSLTLIFSIWNTMMGSSLLALPWGFSKSGLLVGFGIVLAIYAVCCYTCLLVVRWGRGSDDLFYVCYNHLGQTGKIVCWASSILLLVGSSIAYDILMVEVCDLIVDSGFALADKEITNDYYWNTYYAAGLVTGLVFPMTMLKEFGILVKFNTLGIISVVYTLVFILVYCLFFQGVTVKSVPLTNSGYFVLAGMLSVSFFIHSLILPILKNARNPENNARDVTIGYTLVALSYAAVGSVGYLAYWNDLVPMPEQFLEAFSDTNIGALVAKLFLFFQLVTVFPLLLLIIRIQFFGLLWKNDYPSWVHVMLMNLLIIGIGTAFALYYPNFGTVLSFTGGICGVILVFILPVLVHLVAMKKETGSWGIMRTAFHLLIMASGLACSVGQFLPSSTG